MHIKPSHFMNITSWGEINVGPCPGSTQKPQRRTRGFQRIGYLVNWLLVSQ